jgi:hypothetical protein
MNYLRTFLFHNLGWKILSLVVAVVLWAVVATDPELATFALAPLEYKNLPDDLEISSEPISSVSLELRGPSGQLRDGTVRPAVVLDMASVQPGERTFAIGADNVKLSRSVRLVRSKPSEVRFLFERRRVRNVYVEPRFVGDGLHGYTVAHWEVEPKQLVVVGPASRVGRIETVFTDPIDVASLVGSAEFRVNAFLNDPYARFQSGSQVKVVVNMRKEQ